jgi:hypothetical protein
MDKVRVGFFSFTEITDPAQHRRYNEWHLFDHMPEQPPIAGVAHGQRWVRTPELARASLVEDGNPLAAVHYVTLYLMTEPVERTLREFVALGQDLRSLGRFHQARRAHLSGPLRHLESHVAPGVLVSADALPYRPHRGVHVLVESITRHDDDYLRFWHTHHAPALCALDGVTGVWSFATAPAFKDLGWKPGNRRITVCWLDGDVASTSDAIRRLDRVRRERAEGITTTELASGFETIDPFGAWDWFDDDAPAS